MTSVDWQSCVQWLVRCRVLSPDHKLVESYEGKSDDVVRILKDGVILCSLLNRLKTYVIDHKAISFKPQTSQYLCRKNIKVFLDTCKSQFGLKESDLFDIDDLFLSKNVSKVIKTLSILSKAPAAMSSQISSFNWETSKEDLAELPEKRFSQDSARESGEFLADEEEVYQSLVDVFATSSQSTLCLTVSGSTRERCLGELLSTELKYVTALKQIIDFFMIPLKEFLKTDEFNKIFFGIKDLYEINKAFCEQLNVAYASSGSIADCFLKWTDEFILYGEFCARLKSAQELLDSLCQNNPTIDIKLKECQNKAYEGRFKLRDMLAIPMQRVLKYHLLLKELIKNTSDSHVDRDKLDSALDEMLNLSLFINEMTRDFETIHQINLIERSIIGLEMPENASLCHYGRLLLDGELQIKFNNKSMKTRYIFLFDKLMVVCRSKSQREYEYKEFIAPREYTVDGTVFIDKSMGHAFTMTKGRPNDMKYTLGSKDQETVTKWMEAVKLAKDNVQPRNCQTSTHDFVITWFQKPEKCGVCHKLLRGIFFQGYQCKKTATIAHKECIGKAANKTGAAVVEDNKAQRLKAYRNSRLFTNQMTLLAVPENISNANPSESSNKEAVFAGSSSPLQRNRSIGSKPIPQIPVQYPAGANIGRRRTVPDLPTVGCSVPQGRPMYVNESARQNQDISRFPWYVGEMSREVADAILRYLPDGSFMIRQSVACGRVDKYALSLKLNEIKHLRIEDVGHKFYLAAMVQFDSIEDLVQYYQKTSLASHFHELQTTLRIPYRNAVKQLRDSRSLLGFCIALYDYEPSETNQLTLHIDDVIVLLSKQHDKVGWWKGTLNGRTGYFPKAYVFFEDDDR